MKFKKILFVILCVGLQKLHSSQDYNPSLAQLTDLAHLAVTAPYDAWRNNAWRMYNRVDINSQDYWGWTKLMTAAHRGWDFDVEMLLRAGADPNLKERMRGKTALMLAVSRNNNANVIEMLLRAGADPNLADTSGKTALMVVIFSEINTNVIEMLLRAGADPNLADDMGQTALMKAVDSWKGEVFSGNTNVVEMLLRVGANPNLKDNAGRTAIDIARSNGYSEDMFRINYFRPGGIKLPAVPPKAIEK